MESTSVIKESKYVLKRLDDAFKILNVSVSVNNTSIAIFIPSTNSADQKEEVSSTTNVTQSKTVTMNTAEQNKQSQYQPDDPDCIQFKWESTRYSVYKVKPGEANSDKKSCDTLH
eukprot:116489_1